MISYMFMKKASIYNKRYHLILARTRGSNGIAPFMYRFSSTKVLTLFVLFLKKVLLDPFLT